MNIELETKIEELIALLQTTAPDKTVSFSLFVNAIEHETNFCYRLPKELKLAGISMRNLAGNFIK